jgi:hypothetical protein
VYVVNSFGLFISIKLLIEISTLPNLTVGGVFAHQDAGWTGGALKVVEAKSPLAFVAVDGRSDRNC